MTITDAIIILSAHNSWRRGTLDEPVNSPKDIGIAIDTLLTYARIKIKKESTMAKPKAKTSKKPVSKK